MLRAWRVAYEHGALLTRRHQRNDNARIFFEMARRLLDSVIRDGVLSASDLVSMVVCGRVSYWHSSHPMLHTELRAFVLSVSGFGLQCVVCGRDLTARERVRVSRCRFCSAPK